MFSCVPNRRFKINQVVVDDCYQPPQQSYEKGIISTERTFVEFHGKFRRILLWVFKFILFTERLKQKKFVLSHTWVNKDVPDINGRKRNFLGKYFQENRLQLQTFMSPVAKNRRGISPNLFLDAVFIDYMDFPEGIAPTIEVFPEEIDENCRNLPLFVLPTHSHYFQRSWCVSELLMNMLSGVSPKVPISFEIPLFFPSLDEEESCFSMIYDRFPSACHPFLTLLFRLFGSKVSRKEDITILSAMLSRTIDALTVTSLSNVMKWKPDRCLRWEPECYSGYQRYNEDDVNEGDQVEFDFFLLRELITCQLKKKMEELVDLRPRSMKRKDSSVANTATSSPRQGSGGIKHDFQANDCEDEDDYRFCCLSCSSFQSYSAYSDCDYCIHCSFEHLDFLLMKEFLLRNYRLQQVAQQQPQQQPVTYSLLEKSISYAVKMKYLSLGMISSFPAKNILTSDNESKSALFHYEDDEEEEGAFNFQKRVKGHVHEPRRKNSQEREEERISMFREDFHLDKLTIESFLHILSESTSYAHFMLSLYSTVTILETIAL
jgi:hypothetical protein